MRASDTPTCDLIPSSGRWLIASRCCRGAPSESWRPPGRRLRGPWRRSERTWNRIRACLLSSQCGWHGEGMSREWALTDEQRAQIETLTPSSDGQKSRPLRYPRQMVEAPSTVTLPPRKGRVHRRRMATSSTISTKFEDGFTLDAPIEESVGRCAIQFEGRSAFVRAGSQGPQRNGSRR